MMDREELQRYQDLRILFPFNELTEEEKDIRDFILEERDTERNLESYRIFSEILDDDRDGIEAKQLDMIMRHLILLDRIRYYREDNPLLRIIWIRENDLQDKIGTLQNQIDHLEDELRRTEELGNEIWKLLTRGTPKK